MFKILLIAIIVLFFVYKEEFENFYSEIKPSFQELKPVVDDLKKNIDPRNVEYWSCEEDIKRIAKGRSLRAPNGAIYFIIKVKNLEEITRTDKSITCIGDASYDSGYESKLLIKVYEDTDGEMLVKLEEQF